jgi:hypothetical protein
MTKGKPFGKPGHKSHSSLSAELLLFKHRRRQCLQLAAQLCHSSTAAHAMTAKPMQLQQTTPLIKSAVGCSRSFRVHRRMETPDF